MLSSFQHPNFGSVRIYQENEPKQIEYFHGSDLASALWYKNPAEAVVDNVWLEYRRKIPVGVGQPAWWLTEPGFYQLLFRSTHPKAIEFQRWVFEDVLPNIRKTGSYSIEQTSKSDLPVLLQSLMPNTDPLTIAALQKRDLDVNNIYDLDFVHKILPYSLSKQSGTTTPELAVLLACSRVLIYGHDYWWSDNDQKWVVTHAGLEYLIAFARPTKSINLSVFGNSHVVLNLIRFLDSESFPQPANSYAPRIVMEPSALMKSGQTNEWYPISEEGLKFFQEIWDGSHLAVWAEFRQLCSCLDTGRYVKFVRKTHNKRAFDNLYMYRLLNSRNWTFKSHPKTSMLLTLKTKPPLLLS